MSSSKKEDFMRTSRKDFVSEKAVNKAILILPVCGTRVAAEFLKRSGVSEKVALRTLLNPQKRRK